MEDLRAFPGCASLAAVGGEVERPSAPGMKYRHYAPHAPLTVVCGAPGSVVNRIAAEMSGAKKRGQRLAALVHTESLPSVSGLGLVLDMGPRNEPAVAGRRLFAHLRTCDIEGVEAILAEGVSEDGLGRAIMNRLLKASGGRIMHVGEDTACNGA